MNADPFLSPIAAGGILGALVIILGLLAWWMMSKWTTGMQTQLTDQKATSADLVDRVRTLEQSLLAEVRTHAHDLLALVTELRAERKDDRHLQQLLIEKLQAQSDFMSARPCLADRGNPQPEPQSMPRIETDTITAKNRTHG